MNGQNIINKAVSYKGQGSYQFTKWRGVSAGTAWCCVFVCYILEQLGISVPGRPVRCDYLDNALMKMGGKHVTFSEARAGDVVLFTWHGGGNNTAKGSRDHVGFVATRHSDNSLTTVEGNTSGSKVAVRHRSPAYVYKIIRLPQAVAGWVQDNKGWWYRKSNGTYPADVWEQINGKWYFFKADGYMAKGWIQNGGKWYFLSDSGAMVTGWQKINHKWYFFNADGPMQTGWRKYKDKWYFLEENGAMISNGLSQVGGAVYAFGKDGEMLEGEIKVKTDEEGRITIA